MDDLISVLANRLGVDPDKIPQDAVYKYDQGNLVPYNPPSVEDAYKTLWSFTGIPDIQGAYNSAQRGEYLKAIGQGGLGLLGMAGMVSPLGRGASAAVKAAETIVPSLDAAAIGARLGPMGMGSFEGQSFGKIGPLRDVEFGAGPIPSTAEHQKIMNRGYGTVQNWIGRSDRFGNDNDFVAMGYNPRYDESIYMGGQVKPAAPNPLLQENFSPNPMTYSAGYHGTGAYPYGPKTLPDPVTSTVNSRYNVYQTPIPYDAPPSGIMLPREMPSPQEMNDYLRQYIGQRFDPDGRPMQAGANGNNSSEIAAALRNILLAQKLFGIH